MRKLWEEVRTREGEIRKPVHLSYEECRQFDDLYLDFIYPIVLLGKVDS
jgi:hypothetical protein